MKKLLILVMCLGFVHVANAQFFNPSATFDVLSINITYGDTVNEFIQAAINEEVQKFLDEFNRTENRQFRVELDNKEADYYMNIQVDSIKYIRTIHKVLAWTLIGLSIPAMIDLPVGVTFFFGGRAIGSDRHYWNTDCSENLRGKDYKHLIHCRRLRALTVNSREEQEAQMLKHMPKAVTKWVSNRVIVCNKFYLSEKKKARKRKTDKKETLKDYL